MRTFDMYLLRSTCINHKWFESGDIINTINYSNEMKKGQVLKNYLL